MDVKRVDSRHLTLMSEGFGGEVVFRDTHHKYIFVDDYNPPSPEKNSVYAIAYFSVYNVTCGSYIK